MHLGAGVASIVAGASLGCLVAFVLWRRLPAAVALVLMAFCGAAIGAGGLLVQDEVNGASWFVTIVAVGVLAPVQTRLVFGPPGPPDDAMVAAEGSAA